MGFLKTSESSNKVSAVTVMFKVSQDVSVEIKPRIFSHNKEIRP